MAIHTLSKNEILDWDTVNWGKALNYWEKNIPENLEGLKALELGSHKGGLSAWLASKGAEVIASDITPLPKEARELHERYDLLNQIEYQEIDALNIPFENHFDIIVFKSIVGGIGNNDRFDRQEKTIQEIYKALKPGGWLLFAENLQSSPLHMWARKKFVRWGDRWRYLKVSELQELFSHFQPHEIKYNGFFGAFGRTEGQKNFLGHVDSAIFNFITPNSWKYIAYGKARKP